MSEEELKGFETLKVMTERGAERVDLAADADLDRLGEYVGLTRLLGETDKDMRERMHIEASSKTRWSIPSSEEIDRVTSGLSASLLRGMYTPPVGTYGAIEDAVKRSLSDLIGTKCDPEKVKEIISETLKASLPISTSIKDVEIDGSIAHVTVVGTAFDDPTRFAFEVDRSIIKEITPQEEPESKWFVDELQKL